MASYNHQCCQLVPESCEDNRGSQYESGVLGEQDPLVDNHYWCMDHRVRERGGDFPTVAYDNI